MSLYVNLRPVCDIFIVVLLTSLTATCVGGSKDEHRDDDNLEEFCQHETMSIRCRWKSEVIVMTSARWGRMKANRCLNIHSNFLVNYAHDTMFLGCSEDVISIVDKQCSGRSECDLHIHDQLSARTPCYPDLARYLQSSYKCIKVVQESRTCTVTATTDKQYIASASTVSADASAVSNCGSKTHPWRLESGIGQRLRVSILDFTGPVDNIPPTTGHDATTTSCRRYGYILEKSSKKNVSLCVPIATNEAKRESEVFVSDTSGVNIVLDAGTNSENYNYLVKFDAVGCTNMIPPESAWLRRSGNDVIVGCYLSQQTWQLKCDGNEWKGQIGICPDTYHGTLAPAVTMDTKTDNTLMVTIAMVIIVIAAICICLLVITIGCCIVKSYTRKKSNDAVIKKSTNLKHVLLSTSGNCVRGTIPTAHVGTNGTVSNCSTSAAVSEGATIGSWNQAATQYFVLNTEQAT